MACYSATHLIQLVSASAHSLHISRASCISLSSWNHPLLLSAIPGLDGGFRRGCRAELKAREKELKRSLVAVAVPRRGGEVRKRFLPQRLGLHTWLMNLYDQVQLPLALVGIALVAPALEPNFVVRH